jgi:hypothetical protein
LTQDEEPHVRHDEGRVAEFVDGTLDAGSRAAVVAHLTRCRECRDHLAMLARGLSPQPAAAPIGRSRWLAIAASLFIGVGAVGVYVLGRPASAPPPAASVPPVVAPTPAPEGRPTAPPPSATTPPVTITPPPSPVTRPESTRRVDVRRVAAHTFRLEAGEWIDTRYDPAAALPLVTISSIEELNAASRGALRRYQSLGKRYTVVLDGTVYRVQLP